DALLQSIGQPADGRLADMLDLEKIDDLLGRMPVLELLAPGGPEPQRLLEEIAAHLQVAAGHDVVEDRHALEERDILESPGNAEPGRLLRIHFGKFPPPQPDFAL